MKDNITDVLSRCIRKVERYRFHENQRVQTAADWLRSTLYKLMWKLNPSGVVVRNKK